jgi:CDP-glucose 4,6-dehydratase
VQATWKPDESFWSNRNVAVTGATGFLGSHLVNMLVGAGADVVVLVRDKVPPTAITANWDGQVSEVSGAVEDQATVERMLGEYDVSCLFHLAAQTQVEVANRNPASTFEANVAGTWSVLEASRRSPLIEAVVLASSDKAYGAQDQLPYTEDMQLRATHPYDVSKACADLLGQSYATTFGVPVAITRCGNFFGPGDTNWRRLVPGVVRDILEERRPIIRSDGSPTRDYLYVVDGALSYLQLGECLAKDSSLGAEAFNFSTERPLSVLELVQLIQQAAGTSFELDIRGDATHEIADQYLSAAKARAVLGWKPLHTVEEALTETVAWYREHLGLISG